MKKTVFPNRVTSVTVILTLALCIDCGIFGMAKAVGLLSVNAGVSAVSGSDAVSPTETEPDGVPAKRATVTRDIVGHLYTYAVPPEKAVPFTMTHTVTTDSGREKTTHTPSHLTAQSGAIYNLYNAGGDYTVGGTYDRHNQLSFDTSQDSFSGVLENGEAVGVEIPQDFLSDEDFYGSFTVTLSDGSTLNWPCAKNQHNPPHSFDFDYANAIGAQLPDGVTVTDYALNIPYNTGGLKAVNITRSTLATTVRMRSVDESTAWDNLYPASAVTPAAASSWKDTRLGVETLGFSSDSATDLSAYVSRGGRFYIEETNENRRLRTLTVTSDYDGSDVTSACVTMVNGKYMITMPDYGVNITVESEALPVHKLTIEATTPDYAMNGIQQVDNYSSDPLYQSGTASLRYTNDRCTTKRTNGKEVKRSSSAQKITVNDFYKVGDFTWWTSILAFTHDDKWNLNSSATGSQYLNITNVQFFRVENATEFSVSPASVGCREGVQSGRPFIQFIPQDYDMKVTFDVVERPEGYEDWHRIFVHETRPSTEDTVWCNYLYQRGSSPVLIRGSNENLSISTNCNIVYNNADPMAFPGVENTFNAGWYKEGGLYSYGLRNVNGWAPHSTIVRSWKVFKANPDGTSTGEQVILGHGGDTLSFGGLSEGDYLAARAANSQTNKPIFDAALFDMPDYDIVIEVEFGKTVSPCNIVQQIADENGAYHPISEPIDVTFTGTPRDENTNAFYEGNSVTVSGANNYIGYYKGTKDVSFTVAPPEGYVVSAVEYYINLGPNQKYTDLVRSGNTFTIPNNTLCTVKNGRDTYYNGVGFGVTISYSKFVPLTVNQQADGTPMPDSDAAVGTVTVTSQNSGTFMDSSLTGSPVSSFSAALTKSQSSRSDAVMCSLGSKLSVRVLVNDNSRVIGGVEIVRTRNGVDETLDVEPTKYTQNEAAYNLPEGVQMTDSITVNVIYKTAQRLTVDIKVKTPTYANSFSDNDTTATATVTAMDASSGDTFEKFPVEAGSACDSFTVRGSAPARYLIHGNVRISLTIGNLPEGYVVANVVAVPMKDNGEFDYSVTTNPINPTTTSTAEYDNLRSYTNCTLNIPDGQSYYIRVLLARTSSVTVRLRSRGSSDDARFVDNTMEHTYMIFTHSNSAYGGNFYPVIITNGDNKYNTDAYFVDTDPATRTIDVVEQTRINGSVTMPKGFIIASIVATRTASSGGDAETMVVNSGTNFYKDDNGVEVIQQLFALDKNLLGGCHYDITVNVEKAALIELRSLHVNENGNPVPNTLNNSQVTLANSRGSEDPDDLYSLAEYQSNGSFTVTTGTHPTAYGKNLVTTKGEPVRERYVLRHSDFVLTANPVTGDEVASVVVYDADVPDTKVECEYIGDSGNGKPMYRVPLRSTMDGKLVIDVIFSAPRTYGRLRIINRDIYGNEIDNPGTISVTLKNTIYSRPGHAEGSDTWFSQTYMTGSDVTYEITMGSTVQVETDGGAYYRLSHMTLDGTQSSYGDNNHYKTNITLRENETVTLINYFANTAIVRQSAYYSDLGGNVDPPVIRFSNKTGYIALTSYGYFMQEGEQVFYTVAQTNGKSLIGNFAAGSQSEFYLIVREQAGYVLDHVEFSAPSGSYSFTRAQLTNSSCPEKGQNNIYVSWDDITNGNMTEEQLTAFRQSFKQLQPGNDYSITAYYTTRVIHVSAREITYEEFQRIEEEEEGGFAEYVKTHTVGSYHDPSRVAHANEWSIDGKNDIYYVNSHGS